MRRALLALVRMWALWLVGLLLLTLPPLVDLVRKQPVPQPNVVAPPAPRQRPPSSDLRPLVNALQSGDNSTLVEFFRTRGLADDERQHVAALVGQLGDARFPVRVQASAELEALGPRTGSLLRRALRTGDMETTDRARRLLDSFSPDAAVLIQGVRQLVARRPDGAAASLLRYLPDAETDGVADEIRTALANLEPGPALLVKALTDDAPERRSAAGVLLARQPNAEYRPAVLRLLGDTDGDVRYRVGVALLAAHERAAVPVLIELLDAETATRRWAILDLLYQVAGTQGPATGVDNVRPLWRAWWREHGAKVELEKLQMPGETAGGPTLVVMEPHGAFGTVAVFGTEGAIEKQYLNGDGLHRPVWAQLLPGGKLLAVDHRRGRVFRPNSATEEIPAPDEHPEGSWSVDLPWAVYAEQVNGAFFLVSRDELREVNRDGKTTWSLPWPTRGIASARRLAEGRYLVLTDEGECVRLERDGREVGRFRTGCSLVLAPGIDVTANGRLLVPDFGGNRVVEFGPTGEVLWQRSVERPTSVERLANGNTLVVSTTTRRIEEFDRLGRRVWKLESREDGRARPLSARRVVR